MRLTVDEIMTQIASTVNQEATAPTAGGTEWSLWLQYINRGIAEWARANDWEDMRRVFYPGVTGVSLASISLPMDFRKLADAPKLYNPTNADPIPYPEVLWEQESLYNINTDNYVKILGDTMNGYTAVFSPPTMASGASLQIQYYAMPTSLASPAQYSPVPDAQFLVDRTIAYILEARSDSRFQLEENKARERLLSMVEDHELRKFNSYANPNFVITPERKSGFRVGRD